MAGMVSAGRNEMRIPKSITDHPGVMECESGPDSGVEDYKYAVFLKPEWAFSSGRMEGCRSGHFCTVSEFRLANPVLVAGGAA